MPPPEEALPDHDHYAIIPLGGPPTCSRCGGLAAGITNTEGSFHTYRVACSDCGFCTRWHDDTWHAEQQWSRINENDPGRWYDTINGGQEIEDVEPNTTKDL